ncbi:hypothetical protein LPJ56_002144, partial [Coemansia sp. RSA 2599]
MLASQASAYDIIHASSLNCRTKPTTASKVVKVYRIGDDVDILCQTKGEMIKGNNIWDKTPDDCYVADYYLQTGFSGIFKTLCVDLTVTLGTNIRSSSSSSSSETEDESGLTDVDEQSDEKSTEMVQDEDTADKDSELGSVVDSETALDDTTIVADALNSETSGA